MHWTLEIAATLASETFLTALDAGMFRFVTKGAKGLFLTKADGKSVPFLEAVEKMDKKTKSLIVLGLKGTTKRAGVLAVDGALEGMQEIFTEAGRVLEEDLGTKKFKGKDAGEVLTAEKQRLKESFALGASGGVGMGGAFKAPATYKEAKQALAQRKLDIASEQAGQTATSEDEAQAFKTFAEEDKKTTEEAYNDLAEKKATLSEVTTQEELLNSLDALGGDASVVAAKIRESENPLTKQELTGIVNSVVDDISKVQLSLVGAGSRQTKVARGADTILQEALEQYFHSEQEKLLTKNQNDENAMTNFDFDEFWDNIKI